MGKKRGKTTKRKPVLRAKKRKVTPRVPIRKKKSRKKLRSQKTKARRKSTPRRRKARSPTKERQRVSGNSTRVQVDSRKVGKNVTITRKTTRFTPGLRISRGRSGSRNLRNVIAGRALAHFQKIGPSLKNYYYLRLQYTCKFRGKKVLSHFSIGIARLMNSSEFLQYLTDVCDSFLSSLVGYSREGFSQIRVTAVIVQGYSK